MTYKTEQEKFWAGEFGDAYINRNEDRKVLASKTALFTQVLRHARGVESVLELGANIGLNLRVIQTLLPETEVAAVEINAKAREELEKIRGIQVFPGSILDFAPEELGYHDLTFTAGVLIHINPELLPEVYDRLYTCSNRYILVAEYYNPAPVQVAYRGHSERLFKRDFAGEMMELYPDLHLVDYGFQYRRDPNFPGDDITWFLMEKTL